VKSPAHAAHTGRLATTAAHTGRLATPTARSLRLAAALAAATAAALVLAPATPAASFGDRLWATVNRCDPPDTPGEVGVRVAVPRRPGGGAQWLRVRLQFFDGDARAWKRVRSGGDSGWRRLGSGDDEVQGGTTFTFPPPDAGRRLVFRGVAEVEWRKRRRAVEERRLRTTGGHADASDPALQVSLRSCEIRR
jgi:hypothetical protein